MQFSATRTTAMSAEYAIEQHCSICQRLYISGSFDDDFGIYAHYKCIQEATRVWVSGDNGHLVDTGQFYSDGIDELVRRGNITIVTIRCNAGLLNPQRVICASALDKNLMVNEIEERERHAGFFRAIANQSRLHPDTRGLQFNISGVYPIDISKLCKAELREILSSPGDDAVQSAAAKIFEVRNELAFLDQRYAAFFESEIRPRIWGETQRNEMTWFGYFRTVGAGGELAGKSALYAVRFLLSVLEERGDPRDIMSRDLADFNIELFTREQNRAHMAYVSRECCNCPICDVATFRIPGRTHIIDITTNPELYRAFGKPNESGSATVISDYVDNLRSIQGLLLDHLACDSRNTDKLHSIMVQEYRPGSVTNSRRLKVVIRTFLLDFLPPPRHARQVFDALEFIMSALTQSVALDDMYHACKLYHDSLRSSQEWDYFRVLVSAEAFAMSRVSCVCNGRFQKDCPRRLCDICCGDDTCPSHNLHGDSCTDSTSDSESSMDES